MEYNAAERATRIGTPGANWDESGRWHGHPSLPVKRVYDEWVRLLQTRDEYDLVMRQYGHLLGAEPAECARATELGLKAIDLALAEVRTDNLVPLLGRIIGMDRETVAGYSFSRLSCAESPFGGCLFVQRPVFGDQCVFCELHFR